MYLNFFERFQAFEQSVKLGSFSLAARALDTTTSQISRRIKALEDSLGVSLCIRHQNGITPTDAGVRFLTVQAPVMRAFETLEASFSTDFIQEIRLETPVTLGGTVFSKILEYIYTARKLSFHLIPTDTPNTRPVQPHEFSVVLAPEPPDENVIAMRLGSVEYICACSSEYAQRHGLPQSISDLQTHLLLRGPGSETITMDHKTNWENQAFTSNKIYSISTDMALYSATLSGAGIAIGLPMYLAHEALENGKLLRVMPDWVLPQKTAWLLRSVQRFPNVTTQQFIQAIKKVWENTPGLVI